MAVRDQTDSMFAGNRHVMSWEEILGDDGDPISLAGKIAKFSLTRFKSDGSPKLSPPLLDFSSAVSAQVDVTTPNGPIEVELLPVDTEDLAPKDTDYYFELELFEALDASPVVVATGTLTIYANVVNAATP